MRSVSASNDHNNIKLTIEALEISQVGSNSILGATKVPRHLRRGSVYMIYGLMNDVHEEQSWVCLAIQFFNATLIAIDFAIMSQYIAQGSKCRPTCTIDGHAWSKFSAPKNATLSASPYHPFHHYSPPRTEM
jgi:hypothetical protein